MRPAHSRVPTTTKFGERLRELRLAREWHYDDLVVRAGFSHAYVVQLETGSRIASRAAIVAVALVFALSAEECVDLTLRAVSDRLDSWDARF